MSAIRFSKKCLKFLIPIALGSIAVFLILLRTLKSAIRLDTSISSKLRNVISVRLPVQKVNANSLQS